MMATISTAAALLEVLVRQPAVERLGWTLVHSLWQGGIVAGVLAAMLRAMRTAPAATRYAASCGALAVLLLAAVATCFAVRVTEAPTPAPQPVRRLAPP